MSNERVETIEAKKQKLISKLDRVNKKLEDANRESKAWSNGKYKNFSHVKSSKILIESLVREKNQIEHELNNLLNNTF